MNKKNSMTVLFPRVQEEREERRERVVQLVHQDPPALRVPLEMTVPKEAP